MIYHLIGFFVITFAYIVSRQSISPLITLSGSIFFLAYFQNSRSTVFF
nr:MAG TPA: hypothetical protein [Bacteriophage sp.]